MKTRIACYFDVPRSDNQRDYANYVDVRLARVFSLRRDARGWRIRRSPPRLPAIPVTEPVLTPPVPPRQIDLRPTDTKNELKKKVAAKTGVPFERLRMRLGPFNDVHMFDKAGTIGVASCGATVAIRDTGLPRARELNNFGAADHQLPEWTPEGMGDHPYANWAQTWEDIQAGLP